MCVTGNIKLLVLDDEILGLFCAQTTKPREFFVLTYLFYDDSFPFFQTI